MISKTMEAALNKQIELEAYASFLYLSMASWCDKESLNGCAAFMHRQSDEERAHMLKIFHYIAEIDGHALTPGIAQPPHEFESVHHLFEQVYAHEQKVTKSIHHLVDMCNKEDDYTTLNFLQWYIMEQREEEALMRSILDKLKLIGNGPMSLYYIDKEIQKLNDAEMTAESAEAEV
jgi:ferritin